MKNIINNLHTKNFVVGNTDLDGVFSTGLLCKYFPNLKIGGFTNSADKIWVDKDVNKKNVAYIDIYITNKNVLSIDNHIVQLNNIVGCNTNKINPNLIKGVGVDSYHEKYPFSNLMFIIKIIESYYGPINIVLEQVVGYFSNEPVYLWELLLRTDDTLLTSFKYKDNADKWWKWLLDETVDNSLIKKLYEKTQIFSSQENALKNKEKVNGFLSVNFNCVNDGFKSIKNKNFNTFVQFIGNLLSYNMDWNENNLNEITLFTKREKVDNKIHINNLLLEPNVKTLAFVRKNELSYSFI